jgi:hypothetical protein
VVEITDRESARAWLEGQPREVMVAFAARCALRALPGVGNSSMATVGLGELLDLRAVLTSVVAPPEASPHAWNAASFWMEKPGEEADVDNASSAEDHLVHPEVYSINARMDARHAAFCAAVAATTDDRNTAFAKAAEASTAAARAVYNSAVDSY